MWHIIMTNNIFCIYLLYFYYINFVLSFNLYYFNSNNTFTWIFRYEHLFVVWVEIRIKLVKIHIKNSSKTGIFRQSKNIVKLIKYNTMNRKESIFIFIYSKSVVELNLASLWKNRQKCILYYVYKNIVIINTEYF